MIRRILIMGTALMSAVLLSLLVLVPANATTEWKWTHKVDRNQGGWFEVLVSINHQHDDWYSEVVCAGGYENRVHKTRLGAESIKTGHSTAHCPSGYIPISGYIDRGGYTNDRIWSV